MTNIWYILCWQDPNDRTQRQMNKIWLSLISMPWTNQAFFQVPSKGFGRYLWHTGVFAWMTLKRKICARLCSSASEWSVTKKKVTESSGVRTGLNPIKPWVQTGPSMERMTHEPIKQSPVYLRLSKSLKGFKVHAWRTFTFQVMGLWDIYIFDRFSWPSH